MRNKALDPTQVMAPDPPVVVVDPTPAPAPVVVPVPPSPDTKAGYLTTEFWTHVMLSVVAFVGAGLVMFCHTTLPTWVAGLIPFAAVAAALISQVAYLIHRNGLKKASLATYISWIKVHEPDFVSIWNAIEDVQAGRTPPTNVPDVPPVDAPDAPVALAEVVHPLGMMPGADRPSTFDMNNPVVTHA